MPKKTNYTTNGHNYYRCTATIGKGSDGKPIRKQFYGSSKREAEAKRDEYMSSINKGLSANFDKAVFGHVYKTWFEIVLRPSIALSSYKRYETDYRLRITDCILTNMKLTDIGPMNIQVYYNGLLETNSANTVWNVNKLMNSFFAYCIKAKLIVTSPLEAVELPKDKSVKADVAVLSHDNINKMVTAANEDISNFIFVFAIFTGLRQGEILALTHDDINLEDNIIRVNKTVAHFTVDGKYSALLSSTKTDSSTRDVPILEEIKPMLISYMKYETMKHLKLGIPFEKDSILFSSSSCNYLEASNVRKRLKRLYARLDIKQKSFHILRHTFCTLLAEMGMPLKTASELMGHSDIAITARVYTHVDLSEKKKGIEKLSAFFGD